MTDLTDRERLIQMSTKMDSMLESFAETKGAMKDLAKKVDDLSKEVSMTFAERDERNKELYVSKTEFDPIKRLVYGAVGIVLTAVVLAIFALVTSPVTPILVP